MFKGYTNPFASLFGQKPATPAITPPATPSAPIYPTPTGSPIPAPVTPQPALNTSFSSPVVPQVKPTTPVTPVIPTPPISAPQAPVGLKSPTPAVPQVSDESQKAVTLAEKAVQQSSQISPEELSTQADLDKLIESTKKAFVGTEDKAIPLEFITGQLSSIERRANVLAEPLEKKLSRMQAQRTSSLEASKFALDRADKAVTRETDAAKFTIERGDKQFEQDFDLKKSELAQQNADREFALSEEKFDEDRRQFGLEHALKSRETALKESEKTGTTVEAQSAILDNLSLVSTLLSSGALGAISGIKAPTAFFSGTNAALAKNQALQLKSILSLESRQKLKGSGAISDFEAKTLADASSALGINNKGRSNLKDVDFENQLKKVKGAFATAAGLEAVVKLTDPASGKSEVISAGRAGIDQAIRDGLRVEYQ